MESIQWTLPVGLKKHALRYSSAGNSLANLLDYATNNIRYTEAKTFEEILVILKKDIDTRLGFRKERLQLLKNLQDIHGALIEKRTHLQEIYQYYEKYLGKCRESYRSWLRIHSVKYTAKKLKDKGILVSLGDVKPSALKKVTFEFGPCTDILGIEMRMYSRRMEIERAQEDLCHLLRLQGNGEKMICPLGKATLNIDLLLYLVNRKFYLRKN